MKKKKQQTKKNNNNNKKNKTTPPQKTYINVVSSISKNVCLFVCVEVLRPSQPNGVMSTVVSLPNHMFTGQA